jgi:hypothetical protein
MFPIFSFRDESFYSRGILDLLKKKTDDDIVVKMLVGGEKNIDLLNEYQSIEQRYLFKSIQTKLTTIVADRELSLVIEEKEDKQDAVGLATYSNSNQQYYLTLLSLKIFGFNQKSNNNNVASGKS